MLHGHAEQGHAPHAFTKLAHSGVPWRTALAMVGALCLSAMLNIWFED